MKKYSLLFVVLNCLLCSFSFASESSFPTSASDDVEGAFQEEEVVGETENPVAKIRAFIEILDLCKSSLVASVTGIDLSENIGQQVQTHIERINACITQLQGRLADQIIPVVERSVQVGKDLKAAGFKGMLDVFVRESDSMLKFLDSHREKIEEKLNSRIYEGAKTGIKAAMQAAVGLKAIVLFKEAFGCNCCNIS
ncbi:MAG: hypothetical protein LBN94_01020 [Puniceicoccales bacterium]|nr:hypothetical protein [Puniceicoccales bacterium]